MYASPASNNNDNDGIINWANVAPGGLPSKGTVVVDVYFLAKKDTTGLYPTPPGNPLKDKTVNTATVPQQGTKVDPDGPNVGIPEADSPVKDQSDDEPMQIILPTGVTLVGTSVSVGPAGVQIAWETADESAILGFNVLAGASADSLAAVNVELILASSAGLNRGNAYSYVDAAAPGAYLYALEVIGLDGSVERIALGPVSVGK